MPSTKTSKAKGRRLQNFVRDLILETFPQLDPEEDVKGALMGEGGVDIKLTKKARKLFPYSIECKSYRNPQVYPWYEQACDNIYENTIPIVISKGDRKEPLVTMSLKHFMEKIR